MRREARYIFVSLAIITISSVSAGVALSEEAAPASSGRVYKEVAPDGTVTYTDKPKAADSKEVKVPKGSEYTPAKVPAFTPSKPKTKPKKFEYESFAIVSPKDDEAIWDNTGNITVKVSHVPSLQGGHKIEFLLDGQSAAKGSAISHMFPNVDRGTHQITARIVDHKDDVIETSTITFPMKRHAIGGR